MSDDIALDDDRPILSVAVPMPGVAHMNPINKSTASEMAKRKHEVARAKKGARNAAAIKRAKMIEPAAEAAGLAAESKALDKLSVGELADRATKRNLKIVILGGELFAPTSLREVLEAANICSQISAREAAKTRALDKTDEDETPGQVASVALKQLRRQLREASKAS